MKHIAKYLCISLLIANEALRASCTTTSGACQTAPAGCQNVKTVFIPISQGQNLYTQYHKPMYIEDTDECCWASDLSLTYRFMQTKNASAIASSLFGYPSLQFTGDANGDDTGRAANALIPEYFGMAYDTNTQVCISPRIRNNIIDLQLALGGEKLWFQINLPIAKTNWQLSSCNPTNTVGSQVEDNAGSATITSPIAGAPVVYSFTVDDVEVPNTGIDADGATPGTSYLNQYLESNITITDSFDITTALKANGSDSVGVNYYSLPVYAANGTTVALTNSNQTLITPGTAAQSFTITSTETTPATSVSAALGGQKFGGVTSRNYNLFNFPGSNNCNTSAWGLADIILQLGWDFCKTECKHFGLYIRAVLPTGTTLNSCWANYVFSPIIGNGHHFELGLGLTGHLDLWECDESNFVAYLDGYITHPFGTQTYRSYDLPNMPMSRYSVLKVLNSSYAFSGNLAVLGDVNSACITTANAIRGEAVLDFVYNGCNWQFGAGYAFSGLSKETSNCCNKNTTNCSTTTAASTALYGFKGDAPMTDLTITAPLSLASNSVPLLTPFSVVTPTNANSVYFGAALDSQVATGGTAFKYGTVDNADATNTFSLPNFTGCSGLMGGQVLNRLFGHIDYVWKDCCWQPEFGILGSFGFGSGSAVTAQYWDLGARLGFAF